MAKRNKTSLVQAVCRNCGTPTVGRYCHICGQDLFAGRTHRLREIVGDSLATVFALDGKIPRTLWYLIAFPGRLTKEFYAGRIVRYVNPSKLFWFITIVFFALLWSMTDIGKERSTADGMPAADSAAVHIQIKVAPPGADEIPAMGETTPPVENHPESAEGIPDSKYGEMIDREDLLNYLSTLSPYMTLLLMPIFALLVMLFFWRRERSYSDYLVFALHFNSFVFLLLSAGLVLKKSFPGADGEEWFILWLPAIYLAVAMWRVFRPRIVPMVFKIFLLAIAYGILMLTVFIIFLIVFAVAIKKIDIFAG